MSAFADGDSATRYLLAPTLTLTGPACRHAALPEVTALGRRAFVLGGAAGLAAARPFLDALEGELMIVRTETFRGECTNIAIATAARGAIGCDLVIGLGGGKAIDTAKGAAVSASLPCVTVPTSPATCAAYTPLSIIHDARGGYIESRRLPNPVALLVLDPELMIGAPPRLLSAGCIDALARSWDTGLAARKGVPSSMAALSVAVCDQLWNDTLHPLAVHALEAQQEGHMTQAFTKVVEACVTGAGLAGQLGARFFGRSFSHAIGYALADFVQNGAVLHGEAVGLGILVQCVLDPETTVALEEMRDYFDCLGAPTRFIDLGFENLGGTTGHQLASTAHGLLDLRAAVPFPVTVDDLYRAMQTVEN